jgi:hypothetical protein
MCFVPLYPRKRTNSAPDSELYMAHVSFGSAMPHYEAFALISEGFAKLAIAAVGGRACLSALHLAHLHKQHVVDAVEHAVARPFQKIIVDDGTAAENLSATAAIGIPYATRSMAAMSGAWFRGKVRHP